MGGSSISEEQIQQMKAYFGFDKPWPLAYVHWLAKVCTGDLGTSYRYSEPVWDLVRERLPISTYFGLMTMFLTYGVCIPLGVLKALKHRTLLDTSTSTLIFAGYAIPNFTLAALLVTFFAAKWQWFPTRGFTSEDFENFTLGGKIGDVLWHTTLPLICYMVGLFAFLTMLKKNSLLDNLAADYVRTAVAKGCTFSQAVRRHALRNSFIPIATSVGQELSLFLTGQFLIESIFVIDGIGLLGYTSLMDRDFTVVMGVLTLTALLTLLGNILSDFLVAVTDPRVRFD
jgi:microcin C transport system permease protein